MTLRKTPGALVLGLLASLAAHTALYGGQHTLGGGYHDLLMQITSVAALGFVAMLCALAWTQTASTADGSVLAARLRALLPSITSVMVSAAAWYACVEAMEPHHLSVSRFVLIAVLAAAAFLVLRLAHAIANAFACIALTITRTSFSPLAPSWQRRASAQSIPLQTLVAHRRFARPPPDSVAR